MARHLSHNEGYMQILKKHTHTHGHSTGVGKKSVDFNLCISEVVTISDEENAVRIHSIFFVVTTTQFRWGHEV